MPLELPELGQVEPVVVLAVLAEPEVPGQVVLLQPEPPQLEPQVGTGAALSRQGRLALDRFQAVQTVLAHLLGLLVR